MSPFVEPHLKRETKKWLSRLDCQRHRPIWYKLLVVRGQKRGQFWSLLKKILHTVFRGWKRVLRQPVVNIKYTSNEFSSKPQKSYNIWANIFPAGAWQYYGTTSTGESNIVMIFLVALDFPFNSLNHPCYVLNLDKVIIWNVCKRLEIYEMIKYIWKVCKC